MRRRAFTIKCIFAGLVVGTSFVFPNLVYFGLELTTVFIKVKNFFYDYIFLILLNRDIGTDCKIQTQQGCMCTNDKYTKTLNLVLCCKSRLACMYNTSNTLSVKIHILLVRL